MGAKKTMCLATVMAMMMAVAMGQAMTAPAPEPSTSNIGAANMTGPNGATGQLFLSRPVAQANLGDVVFYELGVKNIPGLQSAQILDKKGGAIVVSLVPTDTTINNADYTGIITYNSEDPAPNSPTEQNTALGVQQFKAPGVTVSSSGYVFSSSFNQDSLMGPMQGKTIADFEGALSTGDLYVVVRTVSSGDSEFMGNNIKSKAVQPSSASKVGFTMGAVAAGVMAFMA